MRGFFRNSLLGLSVVLGLALSSGCAMKQLQETNRRLKESNDRLVTRYNKLEQDLAAMESELADKNRDAATLRDKLDGKETPAPVSESPVDEIEVLGLESETTAWGTVVRLDHSVFFPLGKATLSTQGKRILARLSRIINSRYASKLIRVEGHTDDAPVRKMRHLYPTNWELSTARACSVVRYLVQSTGVSPHRIYPAGFSYYRPRGGEAGRRSKGRNRRVEILILNENA